jgi:hypothetical protein
LTKPPASPPGDAGNTFRTILLRSLGK